MRGLPAGFSPRDWDFVLLVTALTLIWGWLTSGGAGDDLVFFWR